MVQQLIQETPLSKVSESFGIERGFLQNLCLSTEGFASMVQNFCSKLGWSNLSILLRGFKERLAFGLSNSVNSDVGVCGDLLELAKLPYVKGYTARIFWEGGLKSVGAVAESDLSDIVPLLMKACRLAGVAEIGSFDLPEVEDG
jgi:DNA_pol_Q helicase like region helical domain